MHRTAILSSILLGASLLTGCFFQHDGGCRTDKDCDSGRSCQAGACVASSSQGSGASSGSGGGGEGTGGSSPSYTSCTDCMSHACASEWNDCNNSDSDRLSCELYGGCLGMCNGNSGCASNCNNDAFGGSQVTALFQCAEFKCNSLCYGAGSSSNAMCSACVDACQGSCSCCQVCGGNCFGTP